MRPARRFGALAAAVIVVAAAMTATSSPRAEAAGLCIPILMDCSPSGSSSPTGTPTPGSSSGSGSSSSGSGSSSSGSSAPGSDPGDGASAGDGTAGGGPAAAWGPATADDSVTFTQPAAQLSSSSLEVGGLSGVALVQLRLADGTTTTAIRLSADRVAMDDFVLDVRGESNGTSAVTSDARMELRGHVEVYLDSVTAELPGGGHLTLGADTPPPGGELPATWLRVDLGLVGATADGITHTGSDLRVRPGA